MAIGRRLVGNRLWIMSVLLLLFSAVCPGVTHAQSPGEFWALADRTYYEPLLAEQRAARMLIVFPAWAKQFPDSQKPGNRFAWQIALGREIPLFGWQTERVGLQPFSKGKWGIGFWTPVAFHMIEDFKDESNPIVDTDYRLGTMVKFAIGLDDRSWLSARYAPWAHESTHLGDEYTIFALNNPAFERVNVSYEYQEYGVSYARAFDRNSLLTVRHGGIILWGDDGYYSVYLLGSTTPTLSPSEKNYEPSFGFEYRFPAPRGAARQFIWSLDFRNRLEYSFHHPPGSGEHRRPTWTIAFGRTGLVADRRFLRSYFGYFTYGVNPFGQLREQYPWWSAGIGWVFQ